MRKNVLQLIGSFHQGGSERQAVQLTRLLHEEGTYRVLAATLNNEGVLRNEIDKLGLGEITEYRLTSFYDANMVRQMRLFSRFLRENQISVIQTHDFYTNVFGMMAGKMARVPVRIAAKRDSGTKTGFQTFFERRAYRFANAIVANSGAVKDFLIGAGVAGDKITVIHNGIDTDRLSVSGRDRASFLEKLGIRSDPDTKVITLVANMRSEVKNHQMFLRSAKRVIEGSRPAAFVLAGEGELTGQLKDTAKDFGIAKNTHFVGRCEDIAGLLHASDICVLCSFTEGFSNSIIEYMAASKPVVATNVGGAGEAIVDGETGFLVNSDDDREMADRLIQLIDDAGKAEKMGQAGRAFVRENFSLDNQLHKTLELYEQLLGEAKI